MYHHDVYNSGIKDGIGKINKQRANDILDRLSKYSTLEIYEWFAGFVKSSYTLQISKGRPSPYISINTGKGRLGKFVMFLCNSYHDHLALHNKFRYCGRTNIRLSGMRDSLNFIRFFDTSDGVYNAYNKLINFCYKNGFREAAYGLSVELLTFTKKEKFEYSQKNKKGFKEPVGEDDCNTDGKDIHFHYHYHM